MKLEHLDIVSAVLRTTASLISKLKITIGMVGKFRKTRKRRQQGKKQRQKYLMETKLEKKNEDTIVL